MSYADLKHLLADLTLEAVRTPDQVRWPAIAAAYAELAGAHRPASDPWVPRSACLARAALLASSATIPAPTDADVTELITRGLLSARDDGSVSLSPWFLPHRSYFARHAPRLLAVVATLRGTPAPAVLPPALTASTSASRDVRVGAALFNAALFFECHEWFERVWKATAGPERDLYHGIVQAAAAFYHYEKANRHGSRTLMRKGRARLQAVPSPILGIDLARFRENLARWDAHFNGDPPPAAYPRLELSATQPP